MSNQCHDKLLIAKSGNAESLWLPLWMHHRDTAGVMQYLLEEYVSPSIAGSCGMDKDYFRKISLFIAAVHDIGKATVGFQYKIGKSVPDRVSELERYGFIIPEAMDMGKLRRTPHALAGESILRFLNCPESIAAVVGAHHGEPADEYDLADLTCKRKKDIVGFNCYFGYDDQFRSVLEESWNIILRAALDISDLESINMLAEIPIKAQMLISALLIMADWIASNTAFFPLISVDDIGEESVYPERVDIALEKLMFPGMWTSHRKAYTEVGFEHTFGFPPSKNQKRITDIISKTEKPGIYIIEAPMGSGKTEAALSSAELLSAKFHKNGLFFGMPTQATANGIFSRILDWAEKQSEDYFHSIILKHGSAEFNKVFRNIQKGIPDEESDSGLIVHSWFCNNKKACLSSFVVATVDQMLMMALRRRHVMLLHLGLSEKVVIIDEVHAYDAYMSRYLERALQWLGAYNTPVILLSATLPSKKRMSLLRAYLNSKCSDECFEKNISYPLMTWTDGGTIKQEALPFEGSHRSVKIEKCRDDGAIDIIRRTVDAGGCVGIILNTVGRAQSFFETVRKNVTENILLYHAQYIMSDRAAKEEELLRKIGKTSTAQTRKGYVVIGTQVLEQSLDIDFDVLITDICPVDLLLQRIGRLHRHERLRPDKLVDPICYVITDEYEKDKSGSEMIYGKWLLKETVGKLPDSIMLPDDISSLVQNVYNAFDESEDYKDYINNNRIKVGKAMSFLLNAPKDRAFHNLLDKTVNESQAEASVRDGISSLEVLIMKLYNDGSIGFLDGTKLSGSLTDEECEKIVFQKLRLPIRFSQKWSVDKTISELEQKCMRYIGEWQKHYLLAGQLVLFLNENNEAELLDYKLKYDYEIGLICQK